MSTPIVYPFYDPNAATYTIDPNAPGGWATSAKNANYVWGYMSGTVDTTQLNANVAPGDQQKNFEHMVHFDGSTVTPPATQAAPLNKVQNDAPSVGGYYSTST